jgi:hypothetical protein
VIGHDRDNLARGYGGPQEPGRLYTSAMIIAELDGLAICKPEQVQRHVHTQEGDRTAIDTLVRAKRPA